MQIVEKQEVWMHFGACFEHRADFAWFLLTGTTSVAWLGGPHCPQKPGGDLVLQGFPPETLHTWELSFGAND